MLLQLIECESSETVRHVFGFQQGVRLLLRLLWLRLDRFDGSRRLEWFQHGQRNAGEVTRVRCAALHIEQSAQIDGARVDFRRRGRGGRRVNGHRNVQRFVGHIEDMRLRLDVVLIGGHLLLHCDELLLVGLQLLLLLGLGVELVLVEEGVGLLHCIGKVLGIRRELLLIVGRRVRRLRRGGRGEHRREGRQAVHRFRFHVRYVHDVLVVVVFGVGKWREL